MMDLEIDGFFDRELWDLLDDVAFWVKDREGRFVWVNHTLAEQAQASRKAIIGSRDSDWFFNELAAVYMADDAAIIAGGPPMRNKPELVMNQDGGVGWHVTSKFPLVQQGKVAGSFGMSRPMETAAGLSPEYGDLSLIVSYARSRIGDGITVKALADRAHVSLSTLERTVRQHLRITPRELLQRIRMNRARHLLTSSTLQIGEVALACGYESFSSFSRAFRQVFGCAPGAYRG